MKWDFGAAHIGDCAVYLSYDIDAANDLGESKFFKIANLPFCKDQNRETVEITIPPWVPAGRAVLRWDWYALHQYPKVEFYSQCSDVQITSSSSFAVSDIPAYSITSPPIYPATGNSGVGFRNPYGGPNLEKFMTGPPCAFEDYAGNNCALTKSGTTGFVAVAYKTGSGAGGGGDEVDWDGGAGDDANDGKTVTTQQICDANKLQDCNFIDIGDNLVIPCASCGCGVGSAGNGNGGGEDSSEDSGARRVLVSLAPLLFMATLL